MSHALGKKGDNAIPNKPKFLNVRRISLLKTQWEKEKLLVTLSENFPQF